VGGQAITEAWEPLNNNLLLGGIIKKKHNTQSQA